MNKMLTLYYRPSCPFCVRTLAAIDRMKLTVELKDINADPRAREELIEKGGKKQVPYLVDPENGQAMYESVDIIEYLEKHYGSGSSAGTTKIRVHNGGQICGVDS